MELGPRGPGRDPAHTEEPSTQLNFTMLPVAVKHADQF